MLSRLVQRQSDPRMDRSAYSELSQTDVRETFELDIEKAPLTESSTDKAYIGDGDHSKRIDYVLVYETCKEKDEKDDDAKKEAKTSARSRRSFEKRLQKKGLILQHDSVIAEKVQLFQSYWDNTWDFKEQFANRCRLKYTGDQADNMEIESPFSLSLLH